MSALPDDMWRRIMEIGIEIKTLDYKSLCCLSIASRRLRRLSSEDFLWSPLLSDFPSNSNNSSSDNNDGNNSIRDRSSSTSNGKFKALYGIRYEKDRKEKRLERRRVILRISELLERLRKILEEDLQPSEKKKKMKMTVAEIPSICSQILKNYDDTYLKSG